MRDCRELVEPVASICCSTAPRARSISVLARSILASVKREVTTVANAKPRMSMTTAEARKIEPMTRTWSDVRQASATESRIRRIVSMTENLTSLGNLPV